MELGGRAPDEDGFTFDYIDRIKEDMYILKCCFKDLTYFLKLNNLQRELMQYYLEEGSKRGKASNS